MTIRRHIPALPTIWLRRVPRAAAFACMMLYAAAVSAQTELPAQVPVSRSEYSDAESVVTEEFIAMADSLHVLYADTVAVKGAFDDYDVWQPREVNFSPDPTRAVWLSALCPGLGQVYNRRYWKLPIIVGGYLGLAYATSWNNTMLSDYTRAYRDIMDTDPTTNSYMNLFPPTVTEADLDKTWLTNLLQSRKNYFRRNRDLCIISMVGVYLLAMVDAYVDASLSHFDISPDLSMDVVPSVMQDARGGRPSVGLQWALNF